MEPAAFTQMIDDVLYDTLRTYSILKTNDLYRESLPDLNFFKLDHNLKTELDIMRNFVGGVLINYHRALQEALSAQGVQLGDLG